MARSLALRPRLAAVARWRASVRGRLALTNALVASLLLAALVAAQYAALRHALLDRTAALLRAQAQPVIERDLTPPFPRVARGDPRPEAPWVLTPPLASRLANDLSVRAVAVTIYASDGTITARGADPANPPVLNPAAPAAALGRAEAGANDVSFDAADQAAGHALAVLIPLRAPPLAAGGLASGPVIGVAQLATGLADVDATLRNLLAFDAAGVALAVLLAAVSAPLVARTALSPLRRVTAAARAIAGGELRQRAALRASADEVGQLGSAFDDMADRVETMLAAQRRFVADASHELRTPLAVLAGGLDVLDLEGAADPAERGRLIDQLRGEVTRMSRLVQELLDLASLDRGVPLERQPVDAAAIVRDVADEARLLSAQHTILDDAPPHLPALLDADRIRQVLLILTDNAVKHTPLGGEIRLSAAREGGGVVLRVRDTGEGIAPEALPHIFERFYRADQARARAQGRVGLGLAIAQRVVEAHGGCVAAESAPGAGTTMTVRLPNAAGAPTAQPSHDGGRVQPTGEDGASRGA